MSMIETFTRARKAGVPLVAISTPDPAATMAAIAGTLNSRPVLAHDCIRGLWAVNDEASPLANPEMVGSPAGFLMMFARDLPERTVTFVLSADEWMGEATVRQGIWNLRDCYKSSQRMLVLLGSSVKVPPSLANDVVSIDEPYPGEAEVLKAVEEVDASASEAWEDRPRMDGAGLKKMADALRGLPLFAVEQLAAMNCREDGADVDGAWESKRKQVEQQDGLSIYRGKERFADIGGQDALKEFLAAKIKGRRPINGVVFLDEIEKLLAGSSTSGGDSSGVSQGILQALLTYMQDNDVIGLILIGPPGTGKSLLAKAMGNEAGVPTISLDTNGLKGSLVGESERAMRNALKVITSVTGGKSFWIATCNSIGSLPPELRRRFSRGTFFIDLPDGAERAAIWELYMDRYGLEAQRLPADEGWTGAEIRNCCDIADDFSIPLIEAGKYIVPASTSSKASIDALRKECDGRYLSGSYNGLFRATPDAKPKRKMGK